MGSYRIAIKSLSFLLFVGFAFHSYASSYESLDYFERHIFHKQLRRLVVLGDRYAGPSGEVERTGLRLSQHQKMQNLLSVYYEVEESQSQNYKDLLRSRLQNLFNYDQDLFAYSFQFEKRIGANQNKMKHYYREYKAQLPRETEHSFENIIGRMKLEIDQKQFLLQYPVFGRNQVLPGLKETHLEYYDLLVDPHLWEQLSAQTRSKLTNREVLGLENFEEWVQIQLRDELSEEELLSRYFRYRSLGTLPLGENRYTSKTEMKAHFERARSHCQQWLSTNHSLQLDTYLHNLDLYWALYREAHAHPLELPWDQHWKDSFSTLEETPALMWLEEKWSHRWTGFQDISTTSVDTFDEVFQEIENFLKRETLFSTQEVELFEIALAEFFEDSWISRKREEWTYYSLPNELRNFLLVRLFPDLSLKQGRALLEQQVPSLSFQKQNELINQIYRNPQKQLELFEMLSDLDIMKPADAQHLHLRLVQDYVEAREFSSPVEEIPKPLEWIEFFDGSKKRKASLAWRDVTEKWTEIEGVDTLMLYLHLHFVPFLRDEWDRFHLEGERRSRLKQLHQELYRLNNQQNSDMSEKQHEQLVQRAQEIEQEQMNLLFDDDGRLLTDPSSPAVYIANFIEGFKTAPGETLAMIAMGSGFYVVFRVVGGKLVIAAIITDTTIHFWTTQNRQEHSMPWHQLPLEDGSSLGIGKWTAELLQELYDLQHSLRHPHSAEEHLEATEHLGHISSQFFWFGVGSGITARALPWKRIGQIRKKQQLERKWSKTEGRISRNQAEISKLRKQWHQLGHEIRMNRSSPSKALERLHSKRDAIAQRISQLRYGNLPGHQGSLRFLASRTGQTLKRVGESLFLFRSAPATSSKGLRSQIQSWQRSRQLGIAQYQQRLLKIEMKMQKLQSRAAANNLGLFSRWFQSFRKGQKQVEKYRRATDKAMDRVLSNLRHIRQLNRSSSKQISKPQARAVERSIKAMERAQNQLSAQAQRLQQNFSSRPITRRHSLMHHFESFRQLRFWDLRRARQRKKLFDLEYENLLRQWRAAEYLALRQQQANLNRLTRNLILRIEKGQTPFKRSSAQRLHQLSKAQEITKAQTSRVHESLDSYFRSAARINQLRRATASPRGVHRPRHWEAEEFFKYLGRGQSWPRESFLSRQQLQRWLNRQNPQVVRSSQAPRKLQSKSELYRIDLKSRTLYYTELPNGNYRLWLGRGAKENFRLLEKLEVQSDGSIHSLF